MHVSVKKVLQKIVAIILVAVVLFGVLDTNQITTYAYTAQGAMIYSPSGSLVETKKTASPSGEKANGLVHGKPLTVINETTGTDGNLWYQVTYYTSNGATKNTAYVPASSVRLDKDAVAYSTGKASGNITLWSCSESYKKPALATIPSGTKLYITDNKTDGSLWYRVYCTINGSTKYGWVEASTVSVDAIPDLETDATYEQQLIAKGFPTSYAKQLAILHEQYPNWIFEPVLTGLDWNTVITNESKAGRNLVYKTEDDAKKSTASSEYNWYTNTWTIRDSSGWVTAHPDFIAYCMDPRNFLNATNIFMFEDLSYSSSQTISGVNAILKGTFMEKNVTDTDGSTLNYANAFMTIGQSVGVSPYHLAARVRQEQGTNGTSSMISGTYPGYPGVFNYFNYGAYGTGSAVYTSGLSYASGKGWTSRYKSLLGGSQLLAANYISVGQDTLYTQKFDVIATGGLYTHQYMTNVQAAISESKSVASAYTDKTQTFVFKIPVYNNMPSTAVTFTATGNRNNYLSTLNVSGISLTPSFNGATTEYSAIVASTVTSVSVTATPVVSSSKVTGASTYNLSYGSNKITIKCTSASGDVKTYTITIVRETGEVIRGDINGDGQVTIVDLVRLNRHILNVSTLSGSQLEAADVNGNGTVNIQDLVLMNRHILGISSIY